MRYPIALLLAAITTAPALAQTCFRGRPLPTCRTWYLTEAFGGLSTPLFPGPSNPRESEGILGGEVGIMRNRSPVSAVGVGVAITNVGVSLRPRYRRWLTPEVGLDLGPGVQWVPGRIERIEANAQLMWRNLVGVWTTGVMDLGQGPRFELAGGARTGGEAGLATYAAGLATFLWLLATYESS